MGGKNEKNLEDLRGMINPREDVKIDRYNLDKENERLGSLIQVYLELIMLLQGKVDDANREYMQFYSKAWLDAKRKLKANGEKDTEKAIEYTIKASAAYWSFSDDLCRYNKEIKYAQDMHKTLSMIKSKSLSNLGDIYKSSYYGSLDDKTGKYKEYDYCREQQDNKTDLTNKRLNKFKNNKGNK